MNVAEAARLLGVEPHASDDALRRAYLTQIRAHHPDRPEVTSPSRATAIIEAYRLLTTVERPSAPPPPPPPGPTTVAGLGAGVERVDGDTVSIAAPADETFRLLLDAAHDVGEITYVDRSMPIVEVLCRFEGEPATSLVVTLQGRGERTEAFCTVESIEARPAPPVAAVVDLLELALHRRRG